VATKAINASENVEIAAAVVAEAEAVADVFKAKSKNEKHDEIIRVFRCRLARHWNRGKHSFYCCKITCRDVQTVLENSALVTVHASVSLNAMLIFTPDMQLSM